MNNYDYPEGSDTKDAPWNQSDNPTKEFDVIVSQSLSKHTTVRTDDYTLEEDYDDDMGNFIRTSTENTNWEDAYSKEHYTIEELLEEFAIILKSFIEFSSNKEMIKKYQHLLQECQGWTADETVVMED